MTHVDRVPTRAVQDAAQGREGELLDGARLVTTRRTNTQMAQFIEAAEASERELLLSVAAKLGGGPMSSVRITRARKAGSGLLCKRIALGADGRPASDGSPCRMWAGTATRAEVNGASGLANVITGMEASEALILGDHVADSAAIQLVKDREADPAQGLYGRTLSTFRFRPGEPAAVLLDFDRKGMPQAVADRLDAVGGFAGAIAALLPDLSGYARVIRASTSAGLYNQETGERLSGRRRLAPLPAGQGRRR